ncbi:MAG: V-type ATP synthase subunit I [Candidatus Abyssobacteria bacterium SURF_17]|uniref:V-type ATP synthase subunit I n=1 Tax=Candidatus Abyssobacteria bacterium SURF_17 TaxID=2093361 RepID=A0A419F7R3_9BACT|nr:MAG: V-type ATP synthase subunit I [Candidatus Abyssubacteria bacterium SURF_17]
MAVSKVRKLELVAHAECREEIVTALRSLGAVHISDIRELFPESENQLPSYLQGSLSHIKEKLAQLLYCILFVERFAPKPPFLEKLAKSKPVFTVQEFEECLATIDIGKLYEECSRLEKNLEENRSQIEKKETLISDVSHWLQLPWPLEMIRDTQTTCVTLGICDGRAFNLMTEEMAEVSPLYHIEVTGRSRTSVSMVLIYSKSVEDLLAPVLRKYAWRPVRFAELNGTPAQIVATLREEIKELHEHTQHICERVMREFVPALDKLMLLHDHYSQECHTLEVQRHFLFTTRVFLISGWIVADHEEALRKRLGEVTQVFELRCYDPAPGENVPVFLENNRAIAPFTLITDLYGRPQYTEFDPTPLFAPFFGLFFGICLGDAGYGAILAIACFIALKKLNIYGGPRKLLEILVWGGIGSFVFGLLSGGVFCMKTEQLPAIFKSMMLFEATGDVLLFLYIAFGLGLIQILFGIGIKMALNVRKGHVIDAILDQALWILFLISLAPLCYKYLFGGAVGEAIVSHAVRAAKILAVALVLTQGRKTRPLVFSPLRGLLKLYGVMNYFGDVLSYARLMALGLATAFLGMTINDIAQLILGIPYGIGYALAALILVFGHAFNLAINCLGAFVHSLRLQYLEFFSKFFTGGGMMFQPFAEERMYTIVQSSPAKPLMESHR